MDDLLKPKQVSKLLGVSPAMVYKLAEKGKLSCVRFPSCGQVYGKGTLRFKPEDIRAFIEQHYQNHAA